MIVIFSVLRILTIAVEAVLTLRFVLLLVSLCCGVLVVLITRVGLVSPVDGILPVAGSSVGAGGSGNFLLFLKAQE